ncbi:MAG: hypothetical protein LBT09_09510 [Planctomycetaceae bacterium]|jgi:TIGR03009 family protein|nr:hypothetical protein [Planctomycetaceae bacterium]
MKFTFTLFIGITLLFVTINFAQQPTTYPYTYQPTTDPPLQPRKPTQPNTPINNGTLQMQPMQIPPKNITNNGVVTYQNQPTTPTQPTAGFNSPFPTNLAQPNQPERPTQPNHGSYPPNINPPNSNPNPSYNPNPSNPRQPYNPSASGGRFPQVGVGGGNGNNVTINGAGNGVVRVADAGRHVGHSAPIVRVHPFILKPEEQRELDEFLLRWERYSETVNNYEVDFNAFYYDPTNPLSPPVTQNEPQLKPLKIMFGYFKFTTPKKFVYHVEGEWQKKERIKYIDPEITPNVTAEKTIIDGQSLFFYDFPAKKVIQYRMPPEVLNRTIANGPFPLIFGAKAVDMKKRFSMKIVTNPDYRDKEIWLWAVPLLADDQQEFVKIEIRLDKRTLNAMALKRIDQNEKSYTTYTLQNPRVNRLTGFTGLSNIFYPDVPRGWKHEIREQLQANANPHSNPTSTTNITPNRPQPPNTVPLPNQITKPHTTQPRTEVPLYNP